MRFITMSLVLVAAFSMAACTGKNSNDSSQTSTAASTEPGASSASEPTSSAMPAETTAASGDIPSYPGATTQASGSSNMSASGGSASGSVMTTDDSFDKVYTWYQQHMPAGSEKAHTTAPVESAVFTIGDPGQDQTSVTITTQGGKTMITVAHVKK
ncbi:MAG TPA: hypothetical protein VHR97_04650 [Candidatus Baltobacteraceae bacterium]|nr:hypothetical protein [Candidatus Baltobacteraceae bacterium]